METQGEDSLDERVNNAMTARISLSDSSNTDIDADSEGN